MDADDKPLTKNPVFMALFAICMVVSLWAIWQKSIRDESIVGTIDAGALVSATVAAGGVAGFVYNGTGGVFSEDRMTVETTKGVYVISGHHSFTKGEPMKITKSRGGRLNLCSPSLCAQISS